jgi:hypothetical protein
MSEFESVLAENKEETQEERKEAITKITCPEAEAKVYK